MKVGIVSIYGFRPHVEHLFYLHELLDKNGHEVYGLVCDAAAPACYGRLLRGRIKLNECPRCMLGGLRSYPVHNIDKINREHQGLFRLNEGRLKSLSISSTATLSRIETVAELLDDEILELQRRLFPAINTAYASTRRWIDRRKLDAIVGFNGRMDMTAGVFAAAQDAGIRYISLERTWFGHGLQLIPDANCLATAESDRITREYRGQPLCKDQARLAAGQLAKRFLRQNDLEWRVYNRSATYSRWPTSGNGLKVLIIPSSNNESMGSPDWETCWKDNTQALDEMIEYMGIGPSNCVLRCHPNWAERIGRVGGEHSERHYIEWGQRRGVHVVPSGSNTDTYDLLREADLAVLNGGSTAFEAAALGKPVLCLGPSKYQEAGFSVHIHGPDEWGKVDLLEHFDARLARRQVLRFLYTQMRRFPQFVDYVRAETTTRYRYYSGADVRRLELQIVDGHVSSDDTMVAKSEMHEDEVINMMREKQWAELAEWVEPRPDLKPIKIARRPALRLLDGLRDRLPRGDRG